MTDNPNSTLRELAEAATPSKTGWFIYGNHKRLAVCAQPDGKFAYIIPMHIEPSPQHRKDLKFIAEANPARILALLDERDKLAAERDAAYEALDFYGTKLNYGTTYTVMSRVQQDGGHRARKAAQRIQSKEGS